MDVQIFLKDDNGKTYQIKDITDFTLIKSLDSPATAVKLSYLTENKMGRILYLIIKKGSTTTFCGAIDKYICKLGYNMEQYTLEARNTGAMLLDQEAMPAKFKNADFNDIFNKYIAPNCNIKNGVYENGYLSEFVVLKGQNLWSVVNNFCMEAYKTQPFIYNGKVCITYPFKKVILKEPVLAIGWEYKPCEEIEKVFIRDQTGAYKSCVQNPIFTNSKRCKYYIPTSEWEHARDSAENIIKTSMRKSECVKIKLDGMVEIQAGDLIEFFARGRVYKNLTAFEVTTKGSKNFTTQITAVRSDYL